MIFIEHFVRKFSQYQHAYEMRRELFVGLKDNFFINVPMPTKNLGMLIDLLGEYSTHHIMLISRRRSVYFCLNILTVKIIIYV